MCLRYLYVVLFFLPLFPISSRAGFRCQVIDSVSHAPVMFASLIIQGRNIANYADTNGFARLSQSVAGDTIIVRCTGYETKGVISTGTDTLCIIKLAPLMTMLPEVAISATRARKVVPFISKKQDFTFSASDAGLELATQVAFPGTGKLKKLTEVSIKIRNDNKNNLCRLHIYAAKDSGRPGAEILNKNIILHPVRNSRELVIDLSLYNVFFTDSALFIGIEWLGAEEGAGRRLNPKISFSNASTKAGTFTRTLQHRDWVLLIPAITQGKNPSNMLISVAYEE